MNVECKDNLESNRVDPKRLIKCSISECLPASSERSNRPLSSQHKRGNRSESKNLVSLADMVF